VYYFGIRGRAQVPILLGAYGDVPVEWIKEFEWPGELKAKTPFGQVPYLEDGPIKFAQASAIARYIARKGKLEGSTDADFATSEQLYEEAVDIFTEPSKAFLQEGDKIAAVKKVLETDTPKHLAALEKLIIESSGHFTSGPKLVAGEIAVFSGLNFLLLIKQDLLAGFPKLTKFYETTLAEPKFKSYFDAKYPSFMDKIASSEKK